MTAIPGQPTEDQPVEAVDSMCLFIHRTAVVMVDGEVVTCANMYAEHVGRLDEATCFLDIWNGPAMRSVRSCLNTEQEWDQCKTCWFREIRYRTQREAWSQREDHLPRAASDYQDRSWDFRRFRVEERDP